jgi:hypothetical protein
MRIRIALGFGLVAFMVAAACGSDGGDGPPGSGGSGGNGEEDADPPDPGVCRKLCCSSADCSSGETCNPFNAAHGTLGTCSGAGWGADAGAIDPDAGTGSELPASCWTLNPPQCNPVTSEGCDVAGDICDYNAQDDETTNPAVDCFDPSGSEQGPGEACDNVDGPFCIAGFHCLPNN